MRRFPLSALRERLGRTGSLGHAGAWLVREPSPWQPPARGDRLTEPVLPSLALLAGGEALCVELAPSGEGHVTLGRHPGNDVDLPDATLSSTHLVFHPRPGGAWLVQDAGSSNGTRLDGEPLSAPRLYPLRDGARLEAGGVRLTFHDGAGLLARLRAESGAAPVGPGRRTPAPAL